MKPEIGLARRFRSPRTGYGARNGMPVTISVTKNGLWSPKRSCRDDFSRQERVMKPETKFPRGFQSPRTSHEARNDEPVTISVAKNGS
ncbi:hypothetical protein HUG15_15060 [Salicibibacter cibarius]|uniref:Uncharacterized protein n=1 Tax=Salicibibacter cibarius TaxID=2743000 RepID=A0A7T6Z4U7_9BACI|nr:hypothetical protein [Salicibibacter cibarius]QQK76752.1 hypothetical protein HUG15_15060 [Salicibibacter cibarius]